MLNGSIVARAALLSSLVLAAVLVPQEASAGLQFRNMCTTASASIAIRYHHPRGLLSGWRTIGWYNAAPGKTVSVFTGPLSNRYYYFFVNWADKSGAKFYESGEDNRCWRVRDEEFQDILPTSDSGWYERCFRTLDTRLHADVIATIDCPQIRIEIEISH